MAFRSAPGALADHSYRLGALHLRDITLRLPLTASEEDSRTIDVFARVVARPGGEDLPYLLFLQGGPGCEAPRPCLNPETPSWLTAALERYRLVLLDQRGTGLSSPVGEDFLAGKTAADVVEYLSHLRADAIVQDCEAFRGFLGVEKWSVLGQSFGGFTTLHYLCRFPNSLHRVFFTGGLSAVGRHCDEVYRECYARMRHITLSYYRRFPDHRERMDKLVDLAARGDIVLPDGEVVSPSRVRSLGHLLGSDDGWVSLYQLLELDPRSQAFRYDLARLLPFGGRNPLYYVLHESSYADGVRTAWSAERMEPTEFREDPTLLTGEHVRRDWLDTVPAFRPWKEVAELIAQHEWPQLYDAEALEQSGAQGAAAVYANDVYVPLNFSLDTAAHLPGVSTFITSEHEHSGLRTSNGGVLRHLFALGHGERVR